jgi:hypothetical protein
MSRDQLIEGYLRGEISRRRFIRGLVASGVSLGAAIAYGELAPEPVRAAPPYDMATQDDPPATPSPPPPDTPVDPPAPPPAAPQLTVDVADTSLAPLLKGKIAVVAGVDAPATVAVTASSGRTQLGTVSAPFTRAGASTLTIKLSSSVRRSLRRRKSVRVAILGTATDAGGRRSTAATSYTAR